MSERDVVIVRGADAESYLQGQLSQDVAGLGVGESAFSLLLQPQGKVDAWLRVLRLADDEFALDVDAGWGEHVIARLRRFLLRMKVDIQRVDWSVAVFEGDDAPVPEGAWRVACEVPGTTTVLGPALAGGIPPNEYEVLRVRAGVPRMGAELDESTIPESAGVVDRSVSFTKGCYTGQELVARIDARGGRVPTKLRRVRGEVPVGATLVVDDRVVGTVTSAAGGAALAFVRREVEPPADVVARWEGGEAPVRVEA